MVLHGQYLLDKERATGQACIKPRVSPIMLPCRARAQHSGVHPGSSAAHTHSIMKIQMHVRVTCGGPGRCTGPGRCGACPVPSTGVSAGAGAGAATSLLSPSLLLL